MSDLEFINITVGILNEVLEDIQDIMYWIQDIVEEFDG